MEILEGEIWEIVEGYDGQYKVSSLGRLMICFIKSRWGKRRYVNRILKPYINSRGYYKVDLSHVGFDIHRIIAKYFVPNPENKPMVNHIDHNKLNNLPSNLEWVTVAENTAHGLLKRTDLISRYLGVSYQIQYKGRYVKNPWRGRIYVNGKRIVVGHFAEEIEAHLACEAARVKHGISNKYTKPKEDSDGSPLGKID